MSTEEIDVQLCHQTHANARICFLNSCPLCMKGLKNNWNNRVESDVEDIGERITTN